MENMEAETIVKVDNVSMRFNLSKEKIDSMKEYFVKFMKHRITFDEFYALRHVNLEIKRGESLAIIGENGCGKSTLLKIISGIFYPTEGTVSVHGTIAPLIELGAGFDPDLTARENIYLNGALLGYSKSFMDARFQEIMDFAELWDFVDVPIKNYSSGMVARLGFSIATITTPDILIVDEILSVGDIAFQQKCEEKMNQMITEGATLIFVSHSTEQVRRMCKKAIWLKNGIPQLVGEVNEVCDAYLYDLENGRHGIVTLDDLEKNLKYELENEDVPNNLEYNDEKNEHIDFISVLCLPAICLILWSHLGVLWPKDSGIQWAIQEYVTKFFIVPLNLTQEGNFLGLCLIFLIAGFYATHSVLQKNRMDFLMIVLCRIFLPVIASTGFFYIFQHAIGKWILQGETYWGQFSLTDWLYSSLLLENIMGYQSINGATWAIFSGVLFCIMLIFLGGILKQSPRKYLSIVAVFYLLVIIMDKWNIIVNKALFESGSYIMYLVLGQIIYLFWSKKINLKEFSVISAIVYIILVYGINTFYPEHLTMGDSYIVSSLFAYGIAFIVIQLSDKIIAVSKIQKLSYALYLNHMTFGFLLLSVFQQFINSYSIVFIVALIGLLLISCLQYYFIEKPFIKLGKKISQKIESR